MDSRPKIESFRVETPVGSFESDSGNHVVDVVSVTVVILVVLIFKKLYFK
jgi:hypothetical protein